MRLKIVNDTGQPKDTRVIDEDTGEMVENIVDIVIHSDKNGFYAKLIIAGVKMDIKADGETIWDEGIDYTKLK